MRASLIPMLHAAERPTAVGAWRVAAPLIAVDEVEREYIDRARRLMQCERGPA